MRRLARIAIIAGSVLLLPTAGALAVGSGKTSTSTQASDAGQYEQAVTHVNAGDYASAIPILEAIVQNDPNNADAFNYLGYSYRKMGQTAMALENYDKALKLRPKHLGANEYLGELYLELGDLAKAEERLAVLQAACQSCEEYSELKEQVDAFKAK
jgi:predicted Zn-dependent protease